MAHNPLRIQKSALTRIESKDEARLFNALARHGALVNIQIHRMSKRRLSAFPASKARPDLRLGEAAAKGLWPFDFKALRPAQPLWKQLAETD